MSELNNEQRTVDPSVKYRRVVIKLSGEALAGENGTGIDSKKLEKVCQQIVDVTRLGVDVGIVIGGGEEVEELSEVEETESHT